VAACPQGFDARVTAADPHDAYVRGDVEQSIDHWLQHSREKADCQPVDRPEGTDEFEGTRSAPVSASAMAISVHAPLQGKRTLSGSVDFRFKEGLNPP
jgi:hypothetical protein